MLHLHKKKSAEPLSLVNAHASRVYGTSLADTHLSLIMSDGVGFSNLLRIFINLNWRFVHEQLPKTLYLFNCLLLY